MLFSPPNTNTIRFENINRIRIRIYSVWKFKPNTNTNIFGLKILTEYEYEYYSVFEKHRIIRYSNIFVPNYSNTFEYRIIRSPLVQLYTCTCTCNTSTNFRPVKAKKDTNVKLDLKISIWKCWQFWHDLDKALILARFIFNFWRFA